MNRKIRNLWVEALRGNGKAYRKLGILFLQGKGCRRDRKLAKMCLDRAAELGDEWGYLLYHGVFSKNKRVIDARSYEEMCRDLRETRSFRERRRLMRYLEVGGGR